MYDYKYSIIIPHKNIPRLLQRCLKSIPDRSDIQVIVVDDNSNPALVNYEHFPECERHNIEVYFDKTGKGAGRARNVGVKYAKGEWMLFADADDFYISDNLLKLFDINIPLECDVVWWGIESLLLDGNRLQTFVVENNCGLERFPNPEILRSEFAPWKKMVRTSFVKKYNIYFDETEASNDVMFHVKLMDNALKNSIYWFPQLVYVWQQRANSTMYTYTLENSLCRLKVSLKANSFALKRGWGLVDNTPEYLRRVKCLSWYYFYKYYLICNFMLSPKIAWGMFYDICVKDGNKVAIILNPCALTLLKRILYKK